MRDKELKYDSPEFERKVDKSIENFQSGISLKMEVKRGTETRDQDKIVGKIRGKNMEEIQEYSEDLQEEIEERAEELREI